MKEKTEDFLIFPKNKNPPNFSRRVLVPMIKGKRIKGRMEEDHIVRAAYDDKVKRKQIFC